MPDKGQRRNMTIHNLNRFISASNSYSVASAIHKITWDLIQSAEYWKEPFLLDEWKQINNLLGTIEKLSSDVMKNEQHPGVDFYFVETEEETS